MTITTRQSQTTDSAHGVATWEVTLSTRKVVPCVRWPASGITVQFIARPKAACELCFSYDTIRDAILTCARKPTWVSLTYRTETTTKKWKSSLAATSSNLGLWANMTSSINRKYTTYHYAARRGPSYGHGPRITCTKILVKSDRQSEDMIGETHTDTLITILPIGE